jgi:hypothetical protein
MSSNGILQAFKAEVLLADADILTRIDNLRKSLQYSTEGQQVAFNDYLVTLREAVDAIPRLELETDVSPGTENQYSIQLVASMDKIMSDCDKVLRKLSHFQGRLRDAERQINNLKAEFIAWYLLAAASLVASLEDIKLPSKEIRNLAEAEFSRLIHNLDLKVLAVLEDLKLETERVAQHKATQKEKHNLGKDQANASWTSTLPAYSNAIIENEKPDILAQEPEIEEDEPGVPAFVSKKPSIASVTGDDQIKGTFRKTVTSLTPVQVVKDEKGEPAVHVKLPRKRLLLDDEDEEL